MSELDSNFSSTVFKANTDDSDLSTIDVLFSDNNWRMEDLWLMSEIWDTDIRGFVPKVVELFTDTLKKRLELLARSLEKIFFYILLTKIVWQTLLSLINGLFLVAVTAANAVDLRANSALIIRYWTWRDPWVEGAS